MQLYFFKYLWNIYVCTISVTKGSSFLLWAFMEFMINGYFILFYFFTFIENILKYNLLYCLNNERNKSVVNFTCLNFYFLNINRTKIYQKSKMLRGIQQSTNIRTHFYAYFLFNHRYYIIYCLINVYLVLYFMKYS